ncbi:MAG TPA: CaiB/BaiF CoA-transferase family protein [Burkholderiales bacterium]|nr:CaiB/BaiF CoA-transferase family protein [Burkholderiales bacterium]
MDRPLAGVVVLDLTRFLSGPHSTLLLAGLGAEVIKIDDPAGGDPTAGAPPLAGPRGVALERVTPQDYGLAYLKRARCKKSATLNLKHPEGRGLFLDLASHADVVIENFRPGVAERLGIAYEALAARNPRIVYCALTGYGATGPDRDLKAYDLMAQAASGLMAITGSPEGPPTKAGTPLSDMIAGTYAALGVVAALHERNRSGRGQAIDVSMVDCLFSMIMDEPLDCYAALGLAPRQGNRIMRFSPFNTYRSADGWVAIGAATPQEWRGLALALGRQDLLEDPRFQSVGWRIAHNEEVDAIVGDWTRARSTAGIVETLKQHDVPCSPVRTPEEAIAWPHLRARGMVEPLRQPDGTASPATAAGLPIRFSRSPAALDAPAPVPGAHTREVLSRFLGLDEPALEDLQARGVI